jgi:hypothetical protein
MTKIARPPMHASIGLANGRIETGERNSGHYSCKTHCSSFDDYRRQADLSVGIQLNVNADSLAGAANSSFPIATGFTFRNFRFLIRIPSVWSGMS